VYCRGVEDYGVIYLGSPVFKIARLLFVAMFSVHLFACIFFRVKVSSASTPEDVAMFYTSKNVPENVSKAFWTQNLAQDKYNSLVSRSFFMPLKALTCFDFMQDLGQQYVCD
jgi:hypothetical protein